MSSNNGNSNGNGNGQGGPPDHARNRTSQRTDGGEIHVGNDKLAELEEQINWDNLSPIEQYLFIRLEEFED